MKTLETLQAGFLVILILLIAAPAFAQYEVGGDAWEFTVAPALWAAKSEIDLKTNQVAVSGKLSFFDALKDLEGAMMVEYGARKSKFSVSGATIWVALGKDLLGSIKRGDRVILSWSNSYLKIFN